MNRRISTNLADLDPGGRDLPPVDRSGPARLLFIHGNILGFRNVADRLKAACADREDVDAVHIDLVAPTWMKVLGKSIPGLHGWDRHQDRYLAMWGRVVDGWFRGPLDLGRFDAVHLMTQVNAGGLLRWRGRHGEGRGARPRFAINIDSTAAAEVRDFGTPAAARAAFRRSEQRLFDLADLIVCRNAWCAASPVRDYGVPADRVHPAVNSIDLPGPGRARDPERLPGAGGVPLRLAFAGTGWHRKGGDLILAAHQRAVADRCELHVFGREAGGDAGARNVVWHGRVPRADLLERHLPSMDAFVLASRFDMLPWAILEAAAAGLALVAPRVGAIPDVVLDGETGRLFDAGDVDGLAAALVGLVEDPAATAALGRGARAHVAANFDAARTYPALVDRLVGLADADEGAGAGGAADSAEGAA